MKNWLKKLTVPLCMLAIASPALASKDDLDELQDRLGNEWVRVKNDRRHNMQTFVKQEDGKRFRSFKVEATFDGELDDLVRVLLDFDNYRDWSWHVLDNKMLKKVSPTEYYIYVVHDSPYGVPDRDIALRMVFEPQTPSKPYVTLRTTAVPDFIPEKPPLVRMLAEDMVAKLTPLPNGKLLITNEGYVDPGGRMAPWAINFVSRNAPYITLLGMRRQMQQDKYTSDKSPLPFPVNNNP